MIYELRRNCLPHALMEELLHHSFGWLRLGTINWCNNIFHQQFLGGGFKYFLFSSLFGEMIQFDEHIFQMGWFNHQLGFCYKNSLPFRVEQLSHPTIQVLVFPLEGNQERVAGCGLGILPPKKVVWYKPINKWDRGKTAWSCRAMVMKKQWRKPWHSAICTQVAHRHQLRS